MASYFKALQDISNMTQELGVPIDIEKDMHKIVKSCIGTKFSSKWGETMIDLAVKAVR